MLELDVVTQSTIDLGQLLFQRATNPKINMLISSSSNKTLYEKSQTWFSLNVRLSSILMSKCLGLRADHHFLAMRSWPMGHFTSQVTRFPGLLYEAEMMFLNT